MMRWRTMLVAVVAVAMIAAACGDDDNGGYSDEIRNSYLGGCTTEQNQAFCECTLTEIEKRWSEEEFIKFAIEASEEPPEEFFEIAFACLGDADLGG